jgi:hypothetical protein
MQASGHNLIRGKLVKSKNFFFFFFLAAMVMEGITKLGSGRWCMVCKSKCP